MSRESVMKDIEKSIQVYSIKITGDEKNKDDGFYILMNTQALSCGPKEIFHGIKNSTIQLLKDAEIGFEIIRRK